MQINGSLPNNTTTTVVSIAGRVVITGVTVMAGSTAGNVSIKLDDTTKIGPIPCAANGGLVMPVSPNPKRGWADGVAATGIKITTDANMSGGFYVITYEGPF